MYYLLFSVFLLLIGFILLIYSIKSKNYLSILFYIIFLYCFAGSIYRFFYNLQGSLEFDYTAFIRELLIISLLFLFLGKIKIKNYLFFYIYVLLIMIYSLSPLFNPRSLLVSIYGFRWVLVPIIFGLLFTNLFAFGKHDLEEIINFFAIIVIMQSAYGIIQNFYFPPFDYPAVENFQNILNSATQFTDSPIMTGTKIRTYGFTYGITDMIQFLSPLASMLLVLRISGVLKSKLILFSCIFYILWLIISKEKAAIAATMIGLIFFGIVGLIFLRKGKFLLLLSILIFFYLTIYILFNYNIIEVKNATLNRLVDLLSPVSRGTGLSRVEVWKKSFHSFLERPLGYGIGYTADSMKVKDIIGGIQPHNLYLQILIEIGIIGFIIFISLIIVYFKDFLLFLIRFGDRNKINIIIAFCTCIVSTLVYGWFTSALFWSGGIIFWLSLFLSSWLIREYSSGGIFKQVNLSK